MKRTRLTSESVNQAGCYPAIRRIIIFLINCCLVDTACRMLTARRICGPCTERKRIFSAIYREQRNSGWAKTTRILSSRISIISRDLIRTWWTVARRHECRGTMWELWWKEQQQETSLGISYNDGMPLK